MPFLLGRFIPRFVGFATDGTDLYLLDNVEPAPAGSGEFDVSGELRLTGPTIQILMCCFFSGFYTVKVADPLSLDITGNTYTRTITLS